MNSNSYHWTSNTFKEDFDNDFALREIDPPNVGERAILTDCMHDYIDTHFFDWSCKLLNELREVNDECVAKRPGSFVYLGHVFTPYKTLVGVESSFDYMSRHTAYDYLGERLKPEWSWDDFYAASTDKECDLFECDGELWVPASNYLFRWTGER